MNCVFRHAFQIVQKLLIAVLIYLPALYITPTGCLISSSITGIVFSVPLLYFFGNRQLGDDRGAQIQFDHPLHFLAAGQFHDDMRLQFELG